MQWTLGALLYHLRLLPLAYRIVFPLINFDFMIRTPQTTSFASVRSDIQRAALERAREQRARQRAQSATHSSDSLLQELLVALLLVAIFILVIGAMRRSCSPHPISSPTQNPRDFFRVFCACPLSTFAYMCLLLRNLLKNTVIQCSHARSVRHNSIFSAFVTALYNSFLCCFGPSPSRSGSRGSFGLRQRTHSASELLKEHLSRNSSSFSVPISYTHYASDSDHLSAHTSRSTASLRAQFERV